MSKRGFLPVRGGRGTIGPPPSLPIAGAVTDADLGSSSPLDDPPPPPPLPPPPPKGLLCPCDCNPSSVCCVIPTVVIEPGGAFSVVGFGDVYRISAAVIGSYSISVTDNNTNNTLGIGSNVSDLGNGILSEAADLVSSDCFKTTLALQTGINPNFYVMEAGLSGAGLFDFLFSMKTSNTTGSGTSTGSAGVSITVDLFDPASITVFAAIGIGSLFFGPGGDPVGGVTRFEQTAMDLGAMTALDTTGDGLIDTILIPVTSNFLSTSGGFTTSITGSFTISISISNVVECPAPPPPPQPPCCTVGATCGPGNAASSNLTGRMEGSINHVMYAARGNFGCGVSLYHDSGGFSGITAPFDIAPAQPPCQLWTPAGAGNGPNPVAFESEGVHDNINCQYLPQPPPHFINHVLSAGDFNLFGVRAGSNNRYGVGFTYNFNALANVNGTPGGTVHFGRIAYTQMFDVSNTTQFNAKALSFQYSDAPNAFGVTRISNLELPFNGGNSGAGTLFPNGKQLDYTIQAFEAVNPNLGLPCSRIPTSIVIIGMITVTFPSNFSNPAFRGLLIHSFQFRMGLFLDDPFADCSAPIQSADGGGCAGCKEKIIPGNTGGLDL